MISASPSGKPLCQRIYPGRRLPNVTIPASDGRLAIYYGAADSFTRLVFTSIDILLDCAKSIPRKRRVIVSKKTPQNLEIIWNCAIFIYALLDAE